MEVFRTFDQDGAALVGWGVRVLLLSSTDLSGEGPTSRRIAGLGGLVEAEGELFSALSAMIDDPVGYSLFVMECDGFGGLEMGRKAFAMMGQLVERIPVILITKDCTEQRFPEDRRAPIVLRSPVSAVSLRVGFEHAMRDRLVWRAA